MGVGGVFLYDHCGGVDIRICKMLDESLNVWRLAGALCVCVCVCACPAESVSSSATCVLPHACQECGRFVMALPVSLSGEQGGFSSWASLSN